jgi:hypothetical protein
VTFTVAASGSAPVQYQWYVGANAIADATNASYTIASVSLANAGNYRAVVSNPVSSTNSRTAVLTVLPDGIAPAVTNITASATRVVVIYSEPLDANSATNAANYTLSGGATVTSATLSGRTVTLNLGAPLSLGTVYSLTINGVQDVYGNAASATVWAVATVAVDGNFADWTGIAPVYSGPEGVDLGADFKDIYVYNDADYYYFRVTLWHDIAPTDGAGCFPRRANLHFDTDGAESTGHHPALSLPGFGAELLQQSSNQYQEKNGGFNDGVAPVGLNYLISPTVRPASYPASFEWRYSRKATFGGGGLIFSTNTVGLFFQGNNSGFVPMNWAPLADGSLITYTNVASVVVPSLPLGQLGINRLADGRAAVVWDPPGTLQAAGTVGGTWTNVPAATSPYLLPASGSQQYFRLIK